jgi:hypothetical protein
MFGKKFSSLLAVFSPIDKKIHTGCVSPYTTRQNGREEEKKVKL